MKTRCWIIPAVGLALAGAGARAELVNGVKAVVHDAVITYDEVNLTALQEMEYLRRQYRNDAAPLRAKIGEVLTNSLEQLVQRQLILRDWAQAGHSLPESLVDEAVQQRLREQFGNDRATLTKTLQAQGMTHEKYRQQVRDKFIVGVLSARNVSHELVISPHKIEKHYLDHSDKYKVEDEVKLRMIVLNKSGGADAARVRKRAEEILVKLKEGVSFAEMAAVNSEGSQRSQGGDWGWAEKSVLHKELADVAFALKPGQISEVIELPDACFLMLVEDTRPAHVKPLNEVRDEIEHTLAIEERARLQRRYIEKLRAKTFVRYF
jgi:parvulin-like peptidyl-prolyl isomerase